MAVNDYEVDVEGDMEDEDESDENKPKEEIASKNEKLTKSWILDGKIYNYKKEGATEVLGQENALKQAKREKEVIICYICNFVN